MSNLTVKNKRLKMSPGGVITLPVSARRALGMSKGSSTKVTVSINNNSVTLCSKVDSEQSAYRVSKNGQLLLRGGAKDMLLKGSGRHYWLELNDKAYQATLYQY